MLLLVLPDDEPGSDAVLSSAERVARRMGVTLQVLRVGSVGSGGCWHLCADDPLPALRGFVRLRRPRGVVLGPRGWERWGANLINCWR